MDMLEKNIRLKKFFEECMEVLKSKGMDYDSGVDSFSGIKGTAGRLRLKPEQILIVLMDKHWSAILSHAERGQLESEPIRERLKDLANYCALYAVMIGEGTSK